jgi:hypothetical protein
VVTLQFGVENMDIRPAGLPTRGSGHYHLSIDRKLPPFDKPMPVDSSHLDFRDGQTLAKISLTPGEHTLQLLLVDENNMAHDPPVMSAPLRVVVADLANSNRDDRSRRDSPPREASSPGLSQNGPSQYGAPPYGNGPNRYGSNGYGPNRYGPYRYGPHRYGPYRYGRPRFNHYRYGRGWRW